MRLMLDCDVQVQVDQLISPYCSLSDKYRALFSLESASGVLRGLIYALLDESILLRHDIAFTLGQRREKNAVPILVNVLKDQTEHPMVRHEAAEALGTIGSCECLASLKQFVYDEQIEVRETCELAIQRINYLSICEEFKNDVSLSDPHLLPAYPASLPLAKISEIINNNSAKMLNRYRALFTLKQRSTPESCEALSNALLVSNSPLLKHEIAYVMGQIGSLTFFPALKRSIEDQQENSMVRQEAAEALGCIGTAECFELLLQYTKDPDTIVAQACSVVLDLLDYER